ncbi:MAG: hypothetical protein IH946_03540, partial [Bacteroidetes bacterium]|nr:hypothetical protein [Bacteroidota bacterium]
MNIFGAFAIGLKEMFLEFRNENKHIPKWQLIISEIFFRFIVIPFFPISALVVLISNKIERWMPKRPKNVMPEIIDLGPGIRFYMDTAGAGELRC